ncbi:6-phospho-beta-glucosidase [Arthrobacter sp. TMN-37]
MRMTVVGGGSTYTPELIDGIARLRGSLSIDELVLTDPAAGRLELVAGLARRILARAGHPATVIATTDLDAAVTDAAVVLIQLRVGGQAARIGDETWPLECGCLGQETTGAGGLAKALRTVPVVLDVAERVRRLAAPGAWIVDFTNPVGIVTRALLDAGHRAVGLCNVAIGLQRYFARLLEVSPDRIELDHVGLNHLTWEREVRLDGVDQLPLLLDRHAAAIAGHLHLPENLLTRLGSVPSYYLRYFYQHDAVVEEQRREPSRGQRVAEIEQKLLAMYADESLNEKPALLAERGGAFYSEAAINLVASLMGDRGDVQVVNVRNGATFPFLPAEAVIEVPGTITSAAVAPAKVEPVDPLYAGLISHVSAYEELALDAALRGGRDRVFRALLAHPLVGQAALADQLTDRLLKANRQHLAWAR